MKDQITRNFYLHELKCKNKKKTPVPYYYYGNAVFLLQQLQIIRDHINSERRKIGKAEVVVDIISGFRTKAYNLLKGGALFSMHKFAGAADLKFRISGTQDFLDTDQVYNYIIYLIEQERISEGGVGLYPSFVHYDIRGKKARWNKKKKQN